MIQLAELKVYKMIIYQTFTLYINISETDLQLVCTAQATVTMPLLSN